MKKLIAFFFLLAALPAGAQAPAPVVATPAPPAATPPAAPVPRDNQADREALGNAIDMRDVPKATALLDANPKIIKMRDRQGRMPLSHATEYAGYGDNKTAMLGLLIARGADLNASDNQQGQTPLVLTISRGNDNDGTVFNFLVDKGASLTAFGSDGQTPIHAAAAQGSVDVVNRLLAKGVDVNLRSGTGDTPLHAAVASGEVKVVRALLNSGANVNLRNDRGDTPFHVAMRLYGLPDNTAATHTNSGVFFIHYSGPGSGPHQDGSIREALLAKGAQVGLRDQYGLTPLLYALLNRDKSGRFLLLQHHAPVDTQTAFFTAAALDDVPTLTRMAAANPALVTGRAPTGATPLHVAALWNARRSLAWLLKHGAETTARDAYALAPLHYACRAPDAQDTVTDLIAAGANVAAEDSAGDTPLHYAARALARDSAAVLLAHHAQVNSRDGMGATPLLLVSNLTHTDLVTLLVAAGADINVIPRFGGGGLLTNAIQAGAKDTVALLLDKGADPNAQDNYGNGSPLISAIQNRSKDIVALLLDKGADPTVKTPWGDTLLSMAHNYGVGPEIVALIQKHMPAGAAAPDAAKPDAAK